MLDQYKQDQSIAYKILKNAVSLDKCSHAYLIETNGFYDSFNLVKAFAKTILCPNRYTNNSKCNNCQQCTIIESGNFPELKIIEPDGIYIKKQQLQELQEEFNKKAIIGNQKVYIIKEAEKLNKQSANSILKFLEEPETGIIAILITDNVYNILETIVSRCQIIKLNNTKQIIKNTNTLEKVFLNLYNDVESKETELEKIKKTIDFINYYEGHNLETIIYTKKLFHDHIKNKEDLIKSFDTMILYYRDILNALINKKIEFFNGYEEEINKILQTNNIKTISYKLSILNKYREKIKYNANTNLLIDKLIIILGKR